MAIGDELFSLLGLVPSRDRAGIARGTMADEAKASITANSGNAEGRALIDQGARPPDFELPADIPTAYAAGRGPIRAAPYGGPSVIPDVIPPAPSERVVASGPAAAPPPAVVRNSDIILSAMQRQAQAQRMQQIIGSIGMIANAFNRNPDSQASTKASLAGMMGGGGGGAAGGGDVGTLAKLLEMRDAETLRETQIQNLMRQNNWDRQRAEAIVGNPAVAGEYMKPEYGIKREEAKRIAGARGRLEGLAPQLSEMLKQPIEVVKEWIANDTILSKLDPEMRAKVDKMIAETGKIGAETGRITQETEEARKAAMSFEEAKKDPVEFAKRYPQLDTPAKIAAALANRPTYDEFTKNALPNATQHLKEWEQDELRRKDLGLPSRSLPEFVTSMQPKIIKTAEEEASAAGLTEQVKEFSKTQVKAADAARQQIAVTNHSAQDRWNDKLITGAGAFSVYELKGRRLAAELLGYSDAAVGDTQLFFNERRANALKMRGTDMPGALSDGDRTFLLEIAGNEDMSAPTLRRLLAIQEKYHRAQIIDHNEDVKRRKTEDPATWKHLREVALPGPGRFVKEDLEKPAGKAMLKQLYDNADDPEAKRIFDEGYGKGMSDYMLARRAK